MCGIFGIIGKNNNNLAYIKSLSMHAKRRGSDSSGILLFDDENYNVMLRLGEMYNTLGDYEFLLYLQY